MTPSRTPIPIDCPRCRQTLYPLGTFRPGPKLSLPGRLLLALAGAVSASILLGGALYLREYAGESGVPMRGSVAGILLIVPALLPGLVLGWLAYKMPKVQTLRCRKCGWWERFRR